MLPLIALIFSDETNYTEVVLQHSAECNSKSSKENASVIIAAAKGESNKLLQMMSQHPGLRLVNQVHIAIYTNYIHRSTQVHCMLHIKAHLYMGHMYMWVYNRIFISLIYY